MHYIKKYSYVTQFECDGIFLRYTIVVLDDVSSEQRRKGEFHFSDCARANLLILRITEKKNSRFDE